MDKPLILITGVSGRIGTNLVKKFSANYTSVGLDQVPPASKIGLSAFFQIDLSDQKSLEDVAFRIKQDWGEKIVSLIHLAAYYDFEGGNWDKYQTITVDGTANLLKAFSSFELAQVIFSSTMLVHKPCKVEEKIVEEDEIQGIWEYPKSKILAEETIKKQKGSAKGVMLRIAGVYDDQCNSIPLSQHIYRVYKKGLDSHLFPGNQHHGAAYLHMDDLVLAIFLAVEKREELSDFEVFLLGEKEPISFALLQKIIGFKLYQKSWWALSVPKWFAKLGAHIQQKIPFMKKSFIQPWMVDLADQHFDLDCSKALQLLGWSPSHSLTKELPSLIEQFKQDPKTWIERHHLG